IRLQVGAASKPGRVVVVLESVCDGSVGAPLAVLSRIEPIAALEGAVRVRGPLVEIADHVVSTVVAHAVRERARLRDRARELVVAWVVQLEWSPSVLHRRRVEGEHWRDARVMTLPLALRAPVRMCPAFAARARRAPFDRAAEPLARCLARRLSLRRADVALR